VTMCLPEPITDPLAGIDLPAGCQVLNGPNALGYVRTRATPRADLDRMRHQREFMSAMLQRTVGASARTVRQSRTRALHHSMKLTNSTVLPAAAHIQAE